MTVARITDSSPSSNQSFEHATTRGIERAVKTLNNVEGAWVQSQKVIVTDGKISEYRVVLKVSFILED